MKPIQLEMTAFGPYKEKTTIDFASFSHQNLFLISGATGAGKTTIFDAIAYALYDDASGNSRSKDNFKSDFATDQELCQVSFIFEINGKEYKVERSPRQMGPGKRSASKQYESTVAFYHDTGVTTKIKDANQEIEALLAMSYDQFKQIVMLPQGEFKKLLESDSKDKEQIFRNIFQTDVILAFQDHLKKQVADLKKDADEASVSLKTSLRYLTDIEDAPLQDAIAIEDIDTILDRLSYLNHLFSEQLTEQEALHQHKQEKVKQLDQQMADLNHYESLKKEQIALLQQKEAFAQIKQNLVHFEKAQQCLEAKQLIEREQAKISSLKGQLSTTVEKLEDLKKEANLKQVAFEKLNEQYKQLPDWRKQEKEYEKQLEAFEQVENKQAEKENLEKLIRTNQDELKQTNQLLEQLQKEKQTSQQAIQAVNDAKKAKESLEKDKQETEKQRDNSLLRLKNLEEFIKLTNQWQSESDQLIQLRKDATYSHKQLQEMRQLYYDNLAGLLASDLKVDLACPVCGSFDHPHLAETNPQAPTKEDLDRYHAENEQIQAEYARLASRVGSLLEQIKEKEDQLDIIQADCENEKTVTQLAYNQDLEKLNELNQKETSLLQQIEKLDHLNSLFDKLLEDERQCELKLTRLTTLLSNQETQIKDVSEQINQLIVSLPSTDKQATTNLLRELTQQIHRIESNYPLLQNELNRIEKETAICSTEQTSYNNQLETAIQSLNTAELAFKEKLKSANMAEDFEEHLLSEADYQRLYKEHETYDQRLKTNQSNLIKQEQRLAEFDSTDIEQLEITQGLLAEEINQINALLQKLFMQKQNGEKSHAAIMETYESLKDFRNKYSQIKRLADVANGSSKETGRLSFERYVLAIYYEEIVKAANLRLKDMTGGRYLLRRSEEMGKGVGAKGLELDVFDHFTSQTRSVKTLSGGESFKASLALALGLSDVMQQQSGGVHIDTLFIDEGFGSLDSESLDHAIQTLMDLNALGRMVGVISHVDELKNRISTHIEVSHSAKGSSLTIKY